MPDKTGRILSYLPHTFRPASRNSALRAVVQAFGSELQQGENSLAAVMAAHWVDHADRGASALDDLTCLASLYGLAPREGEKVEEFREHLKLYIRTFLEGTVTVRGILRVTAEALGLHISEDLDVWSKRSSNELTTVEARGDDAARLIFGMKEITARGSPARPAAVVSNVDLANGIGLPAHAVLRMSVDGAPHVDITFGEDEPSKKNLDQILEAFKDQPGISVFSADGNHLTIASKTMGQASRLEFPEGDNDAAPFLLGLSPHIYRGSSATSAQVTGAVDLVGGADLSEERYLRLVVDGIHVAEIDCAGPDALHTTPEEICKAINGALNLQPPLARPEKGHLQLTSPLTGEGSSIAFQQSAAQDAAVRLFGPVSSVYVGSDDRAAQFTGDRDLSGGLDLSLRSHIQLKIDGGASVTIDCAGLDPTNTRPSEIAAAINSAFKSNVASQDGRFITITSPTFGPTSEIAIETPPSGDVTEEIFGIQPRIYAGAAATRARIVAPPSEGYNLWARHHLKMAVDGSDPVEIDLLARESDPGAVPLDRLADHINKALGAIVAFKESGHLELASPSTGGSSSLAVLPLQCTRNRPFVTRAIITDEPAGPIFGFIERRAVGAAGKAARLVGAADLSRGVDLRSDRYLRLSLDQMPAVEIDCAGARPRATLIDEVVNRINEMLKSEIGIDFKVASHDGRHLILTSSKVGSMSRIAFEPPGSVDALDRLGLESGTFAGQGATGIDFVGTVPLSAGIDLADGAAVKLAIDGAAPVQIDLSAGHKTLPDIVNAINSALEIDIASQSGSNIRLTLPAGEENPHDPLPREDENSSAVGAIFIPKRRLLFALPDGQDATKTIFGIIPPRSYESKDAAPAKVTGKKELIEVDLQTSRSLRIAVDDKNFVDVDCAAAAEDAAKATLQEITKAINDALGRQVAFAEGKRLTLRSIQAGASAEIILETTSSGDARTALFGHVGAAVGTDPLPAVIKGEADLLAPVDLSRRRMLQLKVDGRQEEIDIAGADPKKTSANEIVDAINSIFPGLATLSEDDRLQLTSPTLGETSSLWLLPLRYLELIEYPPKKINMPAKAVKHGEGWPVVNDGACDVFLECEISAPNGAVGPTLVNNTLGWQIRLLLTLDPGQTARLWRDPISGLRADICSKDAEGNGFCEPVSGDRILSGPLSEQVIVPFSGIRHLAGSDDEPAMLTLNNPQARRLVALRSRRSGIAGQEIALEVKESDLPPEAAEIPVANGQEVRLTGRMREVDEAFHLVDRQEAAVARILASPGIDLRAYADCVVAIKGTLHSGEMPLLIVQSITRLFDLKLSSGGIEELYQSVTIGVDAAPDSLVWQINAGLGSSRQVSAEELDKETALTLPQGRSDWRYLDCLGARFDQAHFDADRFAGLECADCWCAERGIFNVSRFSQASPKPLGAVFASTASLDPTVEVLIRWNSNRPGAFLVNLPADLPDSFGGRFNQARFGQSEGTAEAYEKAVTEPLSDERYLVKLVNFSPVHLVRAELVSLVPLGWTAVKMPFREPQFLTLGSENSPARLYLAEDGLSGFIMLQAREPGTWGNEISVAVRPAGPAMYDVSVIFKGACFENARQVALGKGKTSEVSSCKKGLQKAAPGRDGTFPGPVGILQAKAAGIEADVSRDGTEICSQLKMSRSELNGR